MHTKNPFVPPGVDQPPENKRFKKKKKRTPSGTQSVGPAKNPVTPCTKSARRLYEYTIRVQFTYGVKTAKRFVYLAGSQTDLLKRYNF